MDSSRHHAVIADHVPSVQNLVTIDYPLTTKTGSATSLLHLVAWTGSSDVAVYLIENGFDPNDATEDGSTPLMAAAPGGRLDLTNLLLERGAEVNAHTSSGVSVPSYSKICKDQSLSNTLLAADAEIDTRARRMTEKPGLSLKRER